jgi:hypothetical protein
MTVDRLDHFVLVLFWPCLWIYHIENSDPDGQEIEAIAPVIRWNDKVQAVPAGLFCGQTDGGRR